MLFQDQQQLRLKEKLRLKAVRSLSGRYLCNIAEDQCNLPPAAQRSAFASVFPSWSLEIGSERHSFAMRCSMGKGGGASAFPSWPLRLGGSGVRCVAVRGRGGGRGGACECIPFLVHSRSGVSDIACAPGPALRMAFKANSSTGESSVMFFIKVTFMQRCRLEGEEEALADTGLVVRVYGTRCLKYEGF